MNLKNIERKKLLKILSVAGVLLVLGVLVFLRFGMGKKEKKAEGQEDRLSLIEDTLVAEHRDDRLGNYKEELEGGGIQKKKEYSPIDMSGIFSKTGHSDSKGTDGDAEEEPLELEDSGRGYTEITGTGNGGGYSSSNAGYTTQTYVQDQTASVKKKGGISYSSGNSGYSTTAAKSTTVLAQAQQIAAVANGQQTIRNAGPLSLRITADTKVVTAEGKSVDVARNTIVSGICTVNAQTGRVSVSITRIPSKSGLVNVNLKVIDGGDYGEGIYIPNTNAGIKSGVNSQIGQEIGNQIGGTFGGQVGKTILQGKGNQTLQSFIITDGYKLILSN